MKDLVLCNQRNHDSQDNCTNNKNNNQSDDDFQLMNISGVKQTKPNIIVVRITFAIICKV